MASTRNLSEPGASDKPGFVLSGSADRRSPLGADAWVHVWMPGIREVVGDRSEVEDEAPPVTASGRVPVARCARRVWRAADHSAAWPRIASSRHRLQGIGLKRRQALTDETLRPGRRPSASARPISSSGSSPRSRRTACGSPALTYVSTWSGFVYTAFVVDAFGRTIVVQDISWLVLSGPELECGSIAAGGDSTCLILAGTPKRRNFLCFGRASTP